MHDIYESNIQFDYQPAEILYAIDYFKQRSMRDKTGHGRTEQSRQGRAQVYGLVFS